MHFGKTELAILAIVLISFIVAGYFYVQMPEMIASHWNAAGRADDYIPKFWGLFLAPVLSIIFLILFILIPKIDPLKENIAKFRKYYNGLVLMLVAFMLYLELLVIIWNHGIRFNMMHAMVPAMAVLFYYVGVLVENAKRNWFVGIRTPWTLSSEKVWDKTHKKGGRLLKVSAVIAALGLFFGSYAILFVLVPIILVMIYLVVYSYFEYQKEK